MNPIVSIGTTGVIKNTMLDDELQLARRLVIGHRGQDDDRLVSNITEDR